MGSLTEALEDSNKSKDDERKQKWVEAVINLTRLTESRNLRWSSAERENLKPSNQLVLSAYQAKFDVDETTLLLQETVPDPEATKRVRPELLGFAAESDLSRIMGAIKNSSPSVTLRILDDKGASLFVFPQVSEVTFLLAAVKYQIANVDQFLNNLRSYAKGVLPG